MNRLKIVLLTILSILIISGILFYMHILSTSKENGVMHQGLSELTDTKINEEKAINITVEAPVHKTVEAYD